MSHTFPRFANTLARLTIWGFVVALAGIIWATVTVGNSSYVTGVGKPRTQPVPFSHEHHVGGLGIDCRYCHASVETSSFAGLPPTATCMNCHSQMWTDAQMLAPVRESFRTGQPIVWQRVHNLAGFVYFDHSIHVNKGVGCVLCHGRVDQMPLTWQAQSLYMQWCLNCHRNPAAYVMPRDQVFNMKWVPPADQQAQGQQLVREYRIKDTRSLTNCTTCHR